MLVPIWPIVPSAAMPGLAPANRLLAMLKVYATPPGGCGQSAHSWRPANRPAVWAADQGRWVNAQQHRHRGVLHYVLDSAAEDRPAAGCVYMRP
jgi:hypothetical protein